jgi:hypothetical protein
MDRGRVGDERGSKEMDGCPLTLGASVTRQICRSSKSWTDVPHGGRGDQVDGHCGQVMHTGPHRLRRYGLFYRH